MKKLKLHETKKLHYNLYLYKLQIRNSLNVIFRTEFQKDGQLSFAREKLDDLTSKYRKGETLTRTVFRTTQNISIEDYLDAKDIYTILKASKDYKIRCEPWSAFYVYSNDRSFLLKIASKLRTEYVELWEPDPKNIEQLMTESNIIMVDSPTEFPIRVTCNGNKVPNDFANWLRTNRDKSRVGDRTLDSIASFGYCNGLYFHVRDEKVLSLVTLLIGNCIRRVDKLVYKADMDKY